MSSNNNKSGSIISLLKPVINLVPKKDVSEGEVTIDWTKWTITGPEMHRHVN